MDKPVPGYEYSMGQMMGMLVIIQMLQNAQEAKVFVPNQTLDKIKAISAKSLAEYLQKPEEDVLLLVNEQLSKV